MLSNFIFCLLLYSPFFTTTSYLKAQKFQNQWNSLYQMLMNYCIILYSLNIQQKWRWNLWRKRFKSIQPIIYSVVNYIRIFIFHPPPRFFLNRIQTNTRKALQHKELVEYTKRTTGNMIRSTTFDEKFRAKTRNSAIDNYLSGHTDIAAGESTCLRSSPAADSLRGLYGFALLDDRSSLVPSLSIPAADDAELPCFSCRRWESWILPGSRCRI